MTPGPRALPRRAVLAASGTAVLAAAACGSTPVATRQHHPVLVRRIGYGQGHGIRGSNPEDAHGFLCRGVLSLGGTAGHGRFGTFDEHGSESAHRLTQRTGHVFHGVVDGAGIGTRYGLRVHGPWDPENGLRRNAHKLLLDPHATAIEGQYDWGQTVFGHDQLQPERMDESDSAPSTPRSVITDPYFDWAGDVSPRIPLAASVIYETHVKGFTQLHPDVPKKVRGTYAGLGHPAAIKHFTDLG